MISPRQRRGGVQWDYPLFSLSKMLLQEKTTFPRGKSLKYILHLSEKKNKNFPKIQKRSQKSQKNLKENPMNPKNPEKKS